MSIRVQEVYRRVLSRRPGREGGQQDSPKCPVGEICLTFSLNQNLVSNHYTNNNVHYDIFTFLLLTFCSFSFYVMKCLSSFYTKLESVSVKLLNYCFLLFCSTSRRSIEFKASFFITEFQLFEATLQGFPRQYLANRGHFLLPFYTPTAFQTCYFSGAFVG